MDLRALDACVAMRMAAGDCLEDALDRHVFSRACTRIYERCHLDCQCFLEVRRSEWSTRVHVRRVQHYTLLRLTFTTSEWDCCNLAVAYNIIAGCTASFRWHFPVPPVCCARRGHSCGDTS